MVNGLKQYWKQKKERSELSTTPHCEQRRTINDHGKPRDKICWAYNQKKDWSKLKQCPICKMMLCNSCFTKRHCH